MLSELTFDWDDHLGVPVETHDSARPSSRPSYVVAIDPKTRALRRVAEEAPVKLSNLADFGNLCCQRPEPLIVPIGVMLLFRGRGARNQPYVGVPALRLPGMAARSGRGYFLYLL